MKHSGFHRAIVAIAMMLIGWLPSLAHDFEVNGIFYDKLNSSEVAVTYKGDYSLDFSNKYAGAVVIPSSVKYNGVTYSVTSIGDYAFSYCTSLTSIQIPNSVTSIGYDAFWGCTSLTSIVIPNSVTSIGLTAFNGCSGLTSIVIDSGNTIYDSRNDCNAIIETASNTLIAGCQNTIIPNSVTSISDYSFYGCSSLTSIKIPNSVTSIGYEAFYGCESLTSIQIPNSVTSIEYPAFSGCESLTSIIVDARNTKYDSRNDCNAIIDTPSNTLIVGCQNTIIPNSVTSIGYKAFYGCTNLTSVKIPNGVTSIGYYAFYKCTNLTSIEIPNSVKSIGNEAFYGCDSLTSIKIPNSVTSIGEYTFYSCNSLTSIEIPNSVTSIGKLAFFKCTSLTSIEIPNSVKSIGYGAFEGCSSLTSIAIGNSVTSIGAIAFRDCSSLTSIEIPNSVTSIGNGAFSGCSSLTSIVVDAGNSIYDSRNDCNAIIETASNTLIVGCQNTIIPNSVTGIENGAFSYCKSLTSIQIPNSVTSIGNGAFTYCKSLTSIVVDAGNSIYDSRNDCNAIIETASNTLIAGCKNTIIPNSVTSIGNYAFRGYDSLTSIEIPNSVTSIGEGAFRDCSSLTSIQIPNSVTSIGDWAFYDCESLTKITCLATNPPTIDYFTFNRYSADLYVPAGCISAYQSANYWKNFNIKEIPTLSTSIALNQTTATLKASETITLIATVLPENATNKSVTWKSSNEAVATVDANGLVTAIAVGEATITATTTDGSNKSATCKVTVTSTLATSITLDYTEYEMVEKSEFQLTATILPESTKNKGVVWSSSDKWVASVNENGLVTAYSVGEATIIVTTVDGSNLSASCTVTVVPTLAESIALDKTEISLEATETATLVATVLPELTTDKSVEWSSSDESVAVVDDNGVVTAISVGDAIITATVTDGSGVSASCQVTVIPTMAVSIELDQTEVSVEEKSEFQLTATILPEHTTNKEVAWSSSDKWVASVDNTGLVTMYSAGEVVITATTTDGTNLSATCRINVYSGIDGVEGDDLIVATIGDNIVVKNAQLGSNVRVYAADGSIISSEVATDSDVVVEVPIKGVYIVSVNGKTFKVIVK